MKRRRENGSCDCQPGYSKRRMDERNELDDMLYLYNNCNNRKFNKTGLVDLYTDIAFAVKKNEKNKKKINIQELLKQKVFNAFLSTVPTKKVSVKVVNKILEMGFDVNTKKRHSYPILYYILLKFNKENPVEDLKILKFVLQKGADTNFKDTGSTSLLKLCLDTGNIEVLKMMLEFDLDCVTENNNIFDVLIDCMNTETHSNEFINYALGAMLHNAGYEESVYCEDHPYLRILPRLFKYLNPVYTTLIEVLRHMAVPTFSELIPKDSPSHPHYLLLVNILCLKKHHSIFLQVTKVIFDSPLKIDVTCNIDFVCTSKQSRFYGSGFSVDTFGAFINVCSEFREINLWLSLFKVCRVTPVLTTEENDVLSPMTLLVTKFRNENYRFTPKDILLTIMQNLIDQGVEVNTSQIDYFQDEEDEEYKEFAYAVKIPDPLYKSIFNGYLNEDCARLLLPFWPHDPLVLFAFADVDCFSAPVVEVSLIGLLYILGMLMQAIDETILSTAVNLLEFLLKAGGPLPLGTKFYQKVAAKVNLLKENIYSREFIEPTTVKAMKEAEQCFTEMHSSPPSLQHLCRTAIRGACPGSNDLPKHLSNLVPHGLKSFLSMQ